MAQNKKEVLILGGTGAMGVSLIDILADWEDWNIYVTSRKERQSLKENITYLKGNAKDNIFLESVLGHHHYDSIVDFMSYGTEEFRTRAELLLNSTDQYIFLSSSRVYAPSEDVLTENSPRLLDTCTDQEYLATDEYALAKARQEDILISIGNDHNNYTIVRPSLTYNINRLQLVISEKEEWLYRALHGRKIVLPADIMNVQTSMAWGADVASGVAGLIGNEKAYGETFNIASPESRSWNEILEICQCVLEDKFGQRMQIVYGPNALEIGEKLNCYYQIKYARGVSRRFDSTKIKSVVEDLSFKSPEQGMKDCLEEFLKHPEFTEIQAKPQAYFDRITSEYTNLKEFGDLKKAVKYFLYRFSPYINLS